MLTNLLRNAAQAEGTRRVRLSAESRGDQLHLRLEDDGSGIREADKSQVFDPFFTTKPVGQGSGLGLSMVHRIVNDHGGTIGVFDSELGGAGFAITLPLEDLLETGENEAVTPNHSATRGRQS
ncbi:sensor histidine kinase [Halomonas alkalicola]|uniref:histidine kinase n=1 Tax=Halomonas alkalicola TaxID=1930622 RepID=A0ABY9H8S4_9GAMM|nr:ATP-binding protein [Halomonas alkalicola]WLI74516.1 ATP-binding protein [Halomonas alkalicola]